MYAFDYKRPASLADAKGAVSTVISQSGFALGRKGSSRAKSSSKVRMVPTPFSYWLKSP